MSMRALSCPSTFRVAVDSAAFARALRTLIVLAAGAVAATGSVGAAETAVLANPSSVRGDELSYTLDVDGTRIATGSPGEASATGAAYVFDCAPRPCAAAVRVAAPDLAGGDRFGAAVALSGDTLAVGAPGQVPGAVYVFVRSGSTWLQQAKIQPDGGTDSEGFARMLALDGNRLVVAAAIADKRTGAAYVFDRSGTAWAQQARLGASDAAAGDGFGRSIAVSGDTVLVGAPLKAAGAGHFANGAVYAFVRNASAWPQQAKLVAQSSMDGDGFGSALALEGDRALIGAPRAANQAGSAFVFERAGSAWSQQAQLVAAAGDAGDNLGWSVALSGNTAIAGAPYAFGSCGMSYRFVHSGSTWSEAAGSSVGTSVDGNLAGWAVAADQGRWVVAAPGNNGPLQHIGVAYWFDAVDSVFGDGFDASGTVACAHSARYRASTR